MSDLCGDNMQCLRLGQSNSCLCDAAFVAKADGFCGTYSQRCVYVCVRVCVCVCVCVCVFVFVCVCCDTGLKQAEQC